MGKRATLNLAGMLAALLVAVSSRGVFAVDRTHWQPLAGLTWQIQLAEPLVGDPLPVQVYDLDGFETEAATVARLKAQGIRTVCYMNLGTWEEWRPDASRYPPSVIGNAWDEWPGERFLDIRQLDVLAPILQARLDLCAEKGFDAVEPDNIDTYGNPAERLGFPLTEADQLRFNRWIGEQAHARGLAVGQKNAPELASQLATTFDFAVTEDCVADTWCDAMAPYTDVDKPVFAIEYIDRLTEQTFVVACSQSSVPLSLVLKHRNLDAWRMACS